MRPFKILGEGMRLWIWNKNYPAPSSPHLALGKRKKTNNIRSLGLAIYCFSVRIFSKKCISGIQKYTEKLRVCGICKILKQKSWKFRALKTKKLIFMVVLSFWDGILWILLFLIIYQLRLISLTFICLAQCAHPSTVTTLWCFDEQLLLPFDVQLGLTLISE